MEDKYYPDKKVKRERVRYNETTTLMRRDTNGRRYMCANDRTLDEYMEGVMYMMPSGLTCLKLYSLE